MSLEACRDLTASKAGLHDGAGVLVLRVLKAELFRSFDTVGLMDPFAVVEYLPKGSEECKVEIGRTKSAWQAHMHPVWDHMCRAAEYRGPGCGDRLRLRVLEENFGGLGAPTFCGEVVVEPEDLLADAGTQMGGRQPSMGELLASQLQELNLVKRGEHTGNITVQAVLHSGAASMISALVDAGQPMTRVDPSLFVTPVERLGVSGGTAPFFALKLRSPQAGQSASYWIGKDLSRATDEIGFYEQRMAMSKAGSHGMSSAFGFMFDYAGVLECNEAGVDESTPRLQLLVLHNLRDGCRHLRMLDIKVGEKTAAAGWQGKSWFAAMKQSVVDGFTNSQAEGFRLEGFDGQPPSLKSMDPLIDIGGVEGKSKSLSKKAMRLMLQRMPAAEMFMLLMDVHQEPPDVEDVSITLTPSELSEIVMSHMVTRLVDLAVACRQVPAPQKWIGSSVALGFDSGYLPPRDASLEEVSKAVRVNIFDWGRSELNSLDRHTALSAEDQQDRLDFWKFYSGGIDRLAWEAARFHWHRFCNTTGWSLATLTVYDFDSSSANDYIGQVVIPLRPQPESTMHLLDQGGVPVRGTRGAAESASITYSVAWREFPTGSRLRGAWRIHVRRAERLPGMDLSGTSDPFVSITVESSDGLRRTQQSSCVVARNLNPVWDETFEFPVAASHPTCLDKLLELLESFGGEAAELFPPASGKLEDEQQHISGETSSTLTGAKSSPSISSEQAWSRRSVERKSSASFLGTKSRSWAKEPPDAVKLWSELLREVCGGRSFQWFSS